MSPDASSKGRRASSLVEMLVAITLLMFFLVPCVGTMKGQIKDTRWLIERRLAIGLANDILDRYHALGYQWIRDNIQGNGRPRLGVVDSTYSIGALTPNLCYDSHVGYLPVTNFPNGDPPPPNALNPALGGPLYTDPPAAFLSRPDRSADEASANQSLTRATLEGVYKMRRRVEIMGGKINQPAGNWGFSPWWNPGITAPGQQPIPFGIECYLVRVTISTGTSDKYGTMWRPEDMYQVVTVIAKR